MTRQFGKLGGSQRLCAPLDIPSVVCHAVGVSWGRLELEWEVAEWLQELPDDQFGRVEFYIDLLADRGVALGDPYTRQLSGKLRELLLLGAVGQRGSDQLLHSHRPTDHSLDGIPEAATAGAGRD